MRGTPMINRELMILLRSPPGLDSTALGYILGLWPMY